MNVAFLTGTAAGVDVSGMITSITGMMGDFTTDNLLLLLGGGVALAVPCVIAWFGYGFLKRQASKAFKKGKL